MSEVSGRRATARPRIFEYILRDLWLRHRTNRMRWNHSMTQSLHSQTKTRLGLRGTFGRRLTRKEIDFVFRVNRVRSVRGIRVRFLVL